MKKYMLLMLLGAAGTSLAYGQDNETDSVKAETLEEVVVTADREIQKNGYEVLLLSKENRSYGTNALDAVSSLSRFVTSLNATSLLSWDRSEVFVLIDGVPSTAIDLRAYKGDDIKNVEFYSVAPPQYMGFTTGPVVNVVMKKRHDRLYTGYFNTSNAVNTGYGTNQADLAYRDSLNQVRVGYYVDYRNIDDIEKNSTYLYPQAVVSTYDEEKKYKGAYHNISGSYQRYQGRHLFNAKLSYLIRPAEEKVFGDASISDGVSGTSFLNNSLLKSNSKALSLDLYYNYVFSNGSLFAVNVVNTLGDSYSKSSLWSSDGLSSSSWDMPEQAYSYADNDSYSIIASTYFVSQALGGQYAIGSRYEYKQLQQHYAEETDKPHSHDGIVTAGISWAKNGFTFFPTVGLNIQSQVDRARSKTSVLPYARIYSDWWARGALKGLSLQLTMTMDSQAPSLSMLTNSPTFIDYGFYSIGNQYLKCYNRYSAKFTTSYSVPNSKNRIVFIARTNYADNPVASVIGTDDGSQILQPQNINYSHNSRFDLFGSWFPVKWLEISPYMELYTYKYSTPGGHVGTSYFRYGGSVAVLLDKFSLSVHANSPTKDFDGDLCQRGSAQFAVSAQYKYKDWSFGAQCNFMDDNRTTGSGDGFSYEEIENWKPMNTMFRAVVTYSFSVGRSRRHAGKYLNESSDDTGLNKYNTPKMP